MEGTQESACAAGTSPGSAKGTCPERGGGVGSGAQKDGCPGVPPSMGEGCWETGLCGEHGKGHPIPRASTESSRTAFPWLISFPSAFMLTKGWAGDPGEVTWALGDSCPRCPYQPASEGWQAAHQRDGMRAPGDVGCAEGNANTPRRRCWSQPPAYPAGAHPPVPTQPPSLALAVSSCR